MLTGLSLAANLLRVRLGPVLRLHRRHSRIEVCESFRGMLAGSRRAELRAEAINTIDRNHLKLTLRLPRRTLVHRRPIALPR